MAARDVLMAAAGVGGAVDPVFIEDVFSTYLYTGNGATQTITNGIDLSTKGGLVWLKRRSGTDSNFLFDTARGALNEINSDTTDVQASLAASLTAFNTTGFNIGSTISVNVSASTFVSWSFRKQAKFFDIVTYTGDGIAGRTVAHNLGSAPGCIIIKRTVGGTSNWAVYHRSLTLSQSLRLNLSDAVSVGVWNSTAPTSSVFSLGTDALVNASGSNYVAYLFAHDAGGFGDLGTDNVISCGSYTGNGSTTGPIVTLGWEPQWILAKSVGADGWFITDNTRNFSAGLIASVTHNSRLEPQSNGAEASRGFAIPRADGFQIYGADATNTQYNASAVDYVYIAIRRGPMRTPTVGTDILGLNARAGTNINATVTGGQFDDTAIIKNRGAVQSAIVANRLTNIRYMSTTATTAETAAGTTILQANPWDVMDGIKVGSGSAITNAAANTYMNYLLRRAPKFYDSLSYIFPATLLNNTRIPHNLTIAPEMIIAKSRTGALGWYVYHKNMGVNSYMRLNVNNTPTASTGMWGRTDLGVDAPPTATDFGVDPNAIVAASATAIFHLFATCPGVSKVGGYNGAGVGTPQQIDCGFTTGARFVLIKNRSGTAADWYLWDSARGIIAGNDPYFLVNSANAEVTTTDYIDTYSAGFELSATAPAALNNSGNAYIFLAIA